jgi:hypothetical protein
MHERVVSPLSIALATGKSVRLVLLQITDGHGESYNRAKGRGEIRNNAFKNLCRNSVQEERLTQHLDNGFVRTFRGFIYVVEGRWMFCTCSCLSKRHPLRKKDYVILNTNMRSYTSKRNFVLQ